MNKKKAIAEFKKKVADRDALVAEGLETYPVRLYECTVRGYETGQGAFRLTPIYAFGRYETVINDEKSIKTDIEDGFKYKKACFAQCGRKIRMTGVDFKIIREA